MCKIQLFYCDDIDEIMLKMISSLYCAVSARWCLKHFKFSLDGMRIYVIPYEPHTLCLRPFKFFFNSFIDFCSCEIISSGNTRKNEAKTFASIITVVWNFEFTSGKYFQNVYISVVISHMKQKKKRKQTLEGVQ